MNGRNGAQNGKPQNGTNGRQSVMLAPTQAENASVETTPESKPVQGEIFDQPVILQQTNLWSRAIVYGIVGVTSIVLLWASIAKIEEAVPATGKLEPQSQVQPVQAPVGGVVEQILVKEGQAVKQGEVLVRLDPTAAKAKKASLESVRTSLQRQNEFYRSITAGASAVPTTELAQQLKLPPEILALAANRTALSSENQLYKAQLNGSTEGANLTPEQVSRIRAGLIESQTRAQAARFDVSQQQQQLSQTQSQLDAARKSLQIDEKIYNDLVPLLENGGIARLQVVKQEQQVIQSRGEVNRLAQEEQRLKYAIAQAQEKLQNTLALTSTDLLGKIADNEKKLADIDSQINKAIVENENQISDINSQLSETEVTLKYQELRAPVDGVVFDLQAKGPGFVTTNSEPILKVVPNNALLAEVYVTNQDIGFVREGMPVDVRIDSFPFSEFGDIKGKLTQVGSDALPPDQIHQFYRFPAKVELEKQFITVGDKEVKLQSGMSVTTNIITRKRTVLSIFFDMFARKADSLKTVR
jgi:HlyD family secretion protein